MESTEALGAPFPPTANTKSVLDYWRNRSMPDQVTIDWLERIGLSPNLGKRNLDGLRFLGLIDEAGHTTDIARKVREAPDDEYLSVLEAVIRDAYSFVFSIRDPSIDTRSRIEDAFRKQEPSAQRSRMVAYFLGLCNLAGIPLKEAPPSRDSARNRVGAPRKSPQTKPAGSKVVFADRSAATKPSTHTSSSSLSELDDSGLLDPILAGLLKTVSRVETLDELDEWFQVFRATFALFSNLKRKTTPEGS